MLLVVAALLVLAVGWASAGREEPAEGRPEAVLTDEDRAVLEAFVAFARDPGPESWAAVPARPRVGLGLGPRILVTRRADTLARPAAWTLTPAGLFRAGTGPFSVLTTVAGQDALDLRAGPRPRCASPPGPAPRAFARLRRLTIGPAAAEHCGAWWSVELYVTRNGELAAVALDLWEP